VVTAWCAFESTKWGGIQTIRFSRAAVARAESSRSEVISRQMTEIDVASFLAWLQALRQDHPGMWQASEIYRPDPKTLSGFLFARFRPSLRSAFDEWIKTNPLSNPDAPQTPFAMPQYERPIMERAKALEQEAVRLGDEAIAANRNVDNYMLVTVISAMVIFFAGMSTKLTLPASGMTTLTMAAIALFLSLIALVELPVIIFS
jgi:hypothetical protein